MLSIVIGRQGDVVVSIGSRDVVEEREAAAIHYDGGGGGVIRSVLKMCDAGVRC